MQIINQSVTLVTETNPYKVIELAGRVSHKSEDRITDSSYQKFLVDMLKLGHTATLEFGNVYLAISFENTFNLDQINQYPYIEFFNNDYNYCPYCKKSIRDNEICIYTNLRFLLDEFPEIFMDFVNDTLPKNVYKFEPDDNDIYKRYCFNIVTNRGISHELVRHRDLSPLQESTRYVKYDGTMEFISPHWMTECDPDAINSHNPERLRTMDEDSIKWYNSICISENTYKDLISECQLKAQDARGVLPNDLKTELYMCGYLCDWIGHNRIKFEINIFNTDIECNYIKGFDTLRNHKSAHPQAKELAIAINNQLISIIGENKYNEIKEIYV